MAIFSGTRSSRSSNRSEVTPDQVWYINFYLPREDQNGRIKVGNALLSMRHANQAKIIERIREGGAETLQRFIDNVLTIRYTPGKGDHVETRFLNVRAVSKTGHETEIGTIRLSETNPEHVPYILAYDKDPGSASEFLELLEADFQSGAGVVHEYDF